MKETAPMMISPSETRVVSFEPTLRDKLSWLSPQTWWGILKLQDSSSFCDFRMQTCVNGILGVLLPLLVMSILRMAHVASDRLLPATLISPWTIASVATVGTEIRAVKNVCARWQNMRKPLQEDAVNTLQERIKSGRAHRTRRYDIYLAPEYKGQALLFFPGACVPHVAYSEVAAKMSDRGLVVVVPTMEPVCMLSEGLGADAPPMRRIMEQVDSDYLPYQAQWSLGGHSFGAFAAMRLALELHPACIILWGTGPYADEGLNLSALNCPVLVIQASNDKIAEHTPESWEAFLKQLPPDTTRKVIRGGTHNGFATYPNTPSIDGIPGTTKEKQHQQAVSATTKYIFKYSKRR